MKKNSNLVSLGIALTVLFGAAFKCGDDHNGPTPRGGGSVMKILTGVGKPYGARDPRACDNTKAPASGAIPADLAKQYFICQAEGVHGQYLYLVDDVTVVVGTGRPYNPGMESAPEIDPKFPLYSLRGSYTMYQCNPEYDSKSNVGENCNSYVYANQKATGDCYRTTFGDWRCAMSSGDNVTHYGAAPPQ